MDGLLIRCFSVLVCAWLFSANAEAQATNEENAVAESIENAIVLPEPVKDRIEPINRGLWKLNQGLLRVAIQPSAKVYRTIVPSDVRRGIRNAGRNLTYPRNVVNNLLQQKWTGARDETYRFLLNSTAGIGGLFDPAGKSGIRASEADFGQTFRDWGWHPQVYLMLPLSGPSNERDAFGGFMDRMVNPLSYFSPWSYLTLGFMYNNLTDTVDEYIRVAEADFDPYTVLRYAWTVRRESRPTDITPATEHDIPSIETLQSVFFRLRNAEFPNRGEKRIIKIASTGNELPYNLWLQRGKAPLVFLLPGLGSHRLSGGAVAMAEVLHDAGFSVVTVSSPYNYEFMQRAANTPLPGYTPVDANDMYSVLTEINEDIEDSFENRVSSRALLGYSMGGFHSLYLAANAKTNDGVKFDRVVAIDPPVRLDSSITRLDNHYRAALNWPAEQRTDRIEQLFHEVAQLAGQLGAMSPDSPIPLDANESRFLVGLAFRLTLRDIVYLSQTKTNQGIIKQQLNSGKRDPVYREIMQYSFADYLEKFVTPYYRERGIDLGDSRKFAEAVDLRVYESALAADERVRLVANRNDILLGAEDVEWLKKTFGKRLMLFERGGHLGNLGESFVQREIVRALEDLLPAYTRY